MTSLIDTFTPEDQLLLLTAHVQLDAKMETRLGELLGEPLNWDLVLRGCWWHRVRPLVYHHLSNRPEAVPEAFLSSLWEFVQELRTRNERLMQALHDVGGYFEADSQQCLIFKGPTLSQDAYGDLSLRECGDLDLLVRQSDFTSIGSMLAAQKFVPWRNQEDKVQQVFACEFGREDASLDVHWQLAPPWLNYPVHFDDLWEAATPVLDSGHYFRKLCPEDALAVLSIHGTKHWWERLRWLCDIAELVNRGLVQNWQRVESTARLSNCWRSVQVSLWLARHLLLAEIPPEIIHRVDREAGIGRLGRQVSTWLAGADASPYQRPLWSRFRFRMGVCETRRDQLTQFARYLLGGP